MLHDGEHFVEVFSDSVLMLEEAEDCSGGLRAGTWLGDGYRMEIEGKGLFKSLSWGMKPY